MLHKIDTVIVGGGQAGRQSRIPASGHEYDSANSPLQEPVAPELPTARAA